MKTPKSAALQFHEWGANVNAIAKASKSPAHPWKQFHTECQTLEDVQSLPWHNAAGVGVINGPGSWRTFDIDKCPTAEPLERILDALGLPRSYPWVWHSGSGTGLEIAFLCSDELPIGILTSKDKEAGVYWGLPKEPGAFDHIELRWQDKPTNYPPSAYYKPDAPGYQWRGDAPTSPPAVVTAGHVLNAFFAVQTAADFFEELPDVTYCCQVGVFIV